MIIQTILKITALVAIAYLISVIILFVTQRFITYKPLKIVSGPSEHDYDTKIINLKTEDKIKIAAWYTEAKKGLPTIVYFHGNAGNLGVNIRVEKLKALAKTGMGLLAVDWRGYGTSEGSPSEKGLYKDGRAAINHLISEGIELDQIVLYGESLGTGVATQIATEYKVRALVLEAPYTSLPSLFQKNLPFFPMNLILKDKFNTIGKIDKIGTSLLIFHGNLDKIVPVENSFEIIEKAKEPKKSIYYEDKVHNNLDLEKLAKEIYDFTVEDYNSKEVSAD